VSRGTSRRQWLGFVLFGIGIATAMGIVLVWLVAAISQTCCTAP
jgi:hypothetical protein